MRKRSKYRPKGVRLDTLGYIMESFKPVAKHEGYLLDLKIKNSEAMMALTHGAATKSDLDVLVAMSNMTEALCHTGFGEDYKDVAVDGREALLQIVHRAVEIKRFVPTAGQLKALQDLMELHDAQMDVITIKDLERAVEFVRVQFANKRMTILPKIEGVTT